MFYLNQTPKLQGAGSHERPPISFPFSMDFILVAAGGGTVAQASYHGGGGGGGLICSGQALQGGGGSAQVSIRVAGTYSIVIGSETVAQNPSLQGSNSTAFGHTAIGGGKCGITDATATGGNGGSGGGGGGNDTGYNYNGGTGTANQGYGAGKSTYNTGGAGASGGGGGGGAGGAGTNAVDSVPTVGAQRMQKGGIGGLGLAWLDGKVYACGGQGSGGGHSGNQIGDLPANYPSGGAPNRGFGGQYTSDSSNPTGRGVGSTGVCVVRYPFSSKVKVTGGTKTQDGAFFYHTFITSGTLVVG